MKKPRENMIITKTPLRIGFIGGGSDLPSYYNDNKGLIVAASLNKHVYINVSNKFEKDVRLCYSETETVEKVADLKHDIARSILLGYGIRDKIEVSSVAEIPSGGSGLGSSSSYAVGLINAINRHVHGYDLRPCEVANKACEIEISVLKKPIGKQDQYMAAFGGLQAIEFGPDEKVEVKNINLTLSSCEQLQRRLFLVYTGVTRKAESILKQQSELTKNNPDTRAQIREMVRLAEQLQHDLNDNNVNTLGELLDEAWNIKKRITSQISKPEIDEIYKMGKNWGASGGKLLGAGGGGFILFYADEDAQKRIKEKLSNYLISPVKFDFIGSHVIYED